MIKPKKGIQKAAPPTNFRYSGQNWTIRYIEEKPQENLGETHLNINEVRLWVKGLPEDCIRETLQHELLHITLQDAMVILHESNASPHDLEEAVIRMQSPRLFSLLSENPELRRYVYGE